MGLFQFPVFQVDSTEDFAPGSGNITVEQGGGGGLNLTTASDNVILKDLRGPVHAKSARGSIPASGAGYGPWRLLTVSGGISVRVPSELGFDLLARTASGSITTNYPLISQGTLRCTTVIARARNGGFLLDLSTVSGNVRIN